MIGFGSYFGELDVLFASFFLFRSRVSVHVDVSFEGSVLKAFDENVSFVILSCFFGCNFHEEKKTYQ